MPRSLANLPAVRAHTPLVVFAHAPASAHHAAREDVSVPARRSRSSSCQLYLIGREPAAFALLSPQKKSRRSSRLLRSARARAVCPLAQIWRRLGNLMPSPTKSRLASELGSPLIGGQVKEKAGEQKPAALACRFIRDLLPSRPQCGHSRFRSHRLVLLLLHLRPLS